MLGGRAHGHVQEGRHAAGVAHCFSLHVPSVYSTSHACALLHTAFAQMLYGTVLYFTSYIMNKRYRGAPVVLVAGVVAASNLVWIIFPGLAMYASYQMIVSNSYAVFRL